MVEQEDASFIFSDEDFERRYSSDEAAPSSTGPRHAAKQTKPLAAQLARSRNKFMRTLLRRRLSASPQ
jgi:hypothetical protein